MSKREPTPTDNRHDEAEKWYKEVEANRARAIAEATEAGTVIQAERLFLGNMMYDHFANQLNVASDRITAFSILDNILNREAGQYHFGTDWSKHWAGAPYSECQKVYQNTTDTVLLVQMIYTKLKSILENNPKRGPLCMLFLDQWKDSKTTEPTPTLQRAIPQELQTPEATNVIERAIARGLIENAPEGLKWCGSKLLLAYLAYLATSKLNLPTKRYNKGNKKDVLSICWRPFEKLFDLTPDTLKGAKQDWDKWHDEWPNEKPNQHEVIEALFD